MTKRPSILTISLLFVVSLSQAQTSVPPDTVITLQRFADAFNNGVDYRLTINADGTVVFKRFANPFVERSDPRSQPTEPIQSKIPVERVSPLLAEFERIRFFALNDRYAKPEDGCAASPLHAVVMLPVISTT